MSELKYQLMLNNDMSWVPCYLKSEADKVIAHHNYKRCLAMAKYCDASYYQYPSFGEISRKEEWWQKWHVRWLAIASKFKEAKVDEEIQKEAD